jgi:putative redox protein
VFYGEGIDHADVDRAIELSRTKYCSVSAMLAASTRISYSYRIVEPKKSSVAEVVASAN